MHENTALLVSFISAISKKYAPLTISGLSFKNSPKLNKYIKSVVVKYKGENLFLAPEIKGALAKNSELTRFSIVISLNRSKKVEVSFSHRYFKIETLKEKDFALSRKIVDDFVTIYESL